MAVRCSCVVDQKNVLCNVYYLVELAVVWFCSCRTDLLNPLYYIPIIHLNIVFFLDSKFYSAFLTAQFFINHVLAYCVATGTTAN